MDAKRNIRWVWTCVALIVVMISLTGCEFGAGTAPSTTAMPTEEPSLTPEPTQPPTDTPLPPPTDTPAPTDPPVPTDSTPDYEATAAVESTKTAEAFLANVKMELERVGILSDEGSLGWTMTETETIKVDTYNTLLYSTINPDLKAFDFVVHSDITWDSTGGLAVCGIIMRAEADIDNGHHYRFQTIRLSGLPSFDVERWRYGEWQATASGGVVNSKAIDQTNGATNRFTVIARDSKFAVYVNDEKPKTILENQLKEGLFTFMTWQDTGATTCTFSNAWVSLLR